MALWRFKERCYDLSVKPLIMGVLNLTPDSFSDGNSYGSLQAAVASAEKMVTDGADIIDVGGESTRPGAEPVSAAEEIARVIPVIEKLAGCLHVPISIDTWKAEVAKAALQSGAEIVNDISAMMLDSQMLTTVAESDAAVVLMHSRDKPAVMHNNTAYADVVDEIVTFLAARVAATISAGIAADRIVVDPGIGFGKSVAGNLEIIRRLSELQTLDRPLLIGPSRKSFIGATLNRQVSERVVGTAASVAVAMMNGASIFRVHDVMVMRDTVDMVRAIMKS